MLKKRDFFLMGIALLIGFAVWGYHLYSEPHRSAAGEKSVETLTAEGLYGQYAKDEHAADRKYLGKVVEVKGTVADIVKNAGQEIWILSAQNPAGGISCQMFAADKNAHPFKIGDMVTVKGKCTGMLMDVNLVDCTLK